MGTAIQGSIKGTGKRKLTGFLGRIDRAVTDAFFPGICFGCRQFIGPDRPLQEPGAAVISDPEITAESIFAKVTANFLCRDCRRNFVPIASPVCSCCGQNFQTRSGDDHLCGDCIGREKSFDAARAAGEYDGALMDLVHAYKYLGKLQLARPLGAMLLHGFSRHFADSGIDCMVPVPLHPKKLRQRGFNQVILMLDRWRKISISELQPGLFTPEIADILKRTRNTGSQTGLDKKGRKLNVRNAFEASDTDLVAGKRVLLVDDVYTTGATLGECARVLKLSGAEKVFVLTLARAMRG